MLTVSGRRLIRRQRLVGTSRTVFKRAIILAVTRHAGRGTGGQILTLAFTAGSSMSKQNVGSAVS